jgi:hypothetical protein
MRTAFAVLATETLVAGTLVAGMLVAGMLVAGMLVAGMLTVVTMLLGIRLASGVFLRGFRFVLLFVTIFV